MTITPQQLIALLPILIIGLTILVIMLIIAWRRDHCITVVLAMFGLTLALLSLYFVAQAGPMDVTVLLRIDYYSMFYSGLVMLASLATCAFAYSWLIGYPGNCEEFYLLVLIATIGGMVLTSATHLTSLFLGIELLSLPVFGLVGYSYRQHLPLEAAIKYMILSTTVSLFLLFGVALLYAASGDLSLAGLGKSWQENLMNKPILQAGLGMIIVALGFKLSLVPFQLWTPDVYQGAPAPVSAPLLSPSLPNHKTLTSI